ncbi:hypothetical protein L1987_16142 [Smallanthus sonchifolius]|uniref:Uncharacterized protein n=1 Tax=Smallanthus sonchifolius TaxID=185202 RepID=A0ACB9J7E2_9ASTR|nr:hypothetical protein L1987_16142 [Smallanthus sonchifolius]
MITRIKETESKIPLPILRKEGMRSLIQMRFKGSIGQRGGGGRQVFNEGVGSPFPIHPAVDLNETPIASLTICREEEMGDYSVANVDLEIQNTIEVGLCVGIDVSMFKDQVQDIILGESHIWDSEKNQSEKSVGEWQHDF